MLSWKKKLQNFSEEIIKICNAQQIRLKHNLLPLHDNYFGKTVKLIFAFVENEKQFCLLCVIIFEITHCEIYSSVIPTITQEKI